MRSVKPMGRTRGSAPHRVATRAHVVVASAEHEYGTGARVQRGPGRAVEITDRPPAPRHDHHLFPRTQTQRRPRLLAEGR